MQGKNALPELSQRQRREIEYHKDHARQYAEKYRSIDFAVVSFTERRWWNAYWEMYRHIAHADMHGRKALVVGCGFGHDAILLAKLGAQVSAFDLSAELLAIGQDLAARYELNVDFQQMPAERLSYQDGEFDFVLIVDILHHCDVTKALSELARVSFLLQPEITSCRTFRVILAKKVLGNSFNAVALGSPVAQNR